MPTAKMIEVIKVTANVYDPLVAMCHYQEERKLGNYTPLVLVQDIKLRGRTVTSYCVCRIPQGADDDAYILHLKSWARKNKRSDCGVETVRKSQLHVFRGPTLLKWADA